MEQPNVQIMTAEEAKNIDPSLIDFVTMNTGTIIKVGNQPTESEFKEEVCSNTQICQKCGRYRMQEGMVQNTASVLRAGKKNKDEREKIEVPKEEIVVENKEESNQETLKAQGFLLNDLLTGEGAYGDEQQYQENEYQGQALEQGEVAQEQQNYDNQRTAEQQYAQEENQEQNEATGYEQGYYDEIQNQYETEQQPNGIEQNLQYQEEGYANNQGVTEQNVEQNIQDGAYGQEFAPQIDDNLVEYPYQYEQPVPNSYPQNEQKPHEQSQEYAPTQEDKITVQEPIVKPVQKPVEEKPIQPPTQKPVQPPKQQPVQPPKQQPVPPPKQQPVQPPKQQPIQPHTQKPVQPVKPPRQPIVPVQRPMQPPKNPIRPNIQPIQPKIQQKVPAFIPGKIVTPVPPKGQKSFLPQPLGPQKKLPLQPPRVKPLPPGQQKKIIPPQQPKVVMPPGQQKKIIPPQPPKVVMPPGQQKKIIPPQPPKVVMPPGQQKKVIPAQPPHGPHKQIIAPKPVPRQKGFRSRPPQLENDVLRARKVESEEICPDCLKKVQLCPDCQQGSKNEDICPDCLKKTQSLCPACESEEASKTYQNLRAKQDDQKDNLLGKSKKNENKYSSKTFTKKKEFDADFDNYKYHEINATTKKNKKSFFIVKKAGVTISTNVTSNE